MPPTEAAPPTDTTPPETSSPTSPEKTDSSPPKEGTGEKKATTKKTTNKKKTGSKRTDSVLDDIVKGAQEIEGADPFVVNPQEQQRKTVVMKTLARVKASSPMDVWAPASSTMEFAEMPIDRFIDVRRRDEFAKAVQKYMGSPEGVKLGLATYLPGDTEHDQRFFERWATIAGSSLFVKMMLKRVE